MNEMEMYSVQIITHAGAAKSKCFLAIKEAKSANFDKCKALLDEAETHFIEAHKQHASLISKEASGEKVIMTLLLSHAEDQLMNAQMTKEFAVEFIQLYEEIAELKKKA